MARRRVLVRRMARELAPADRLAASYGGAPVAVRDAGRAWYPRACETVAALGARYGLAAEAAAGIVAALSPRCAWSDNLRRAERVAEAAALGDDAPPAVGFSDATRKAWRIAQGEAAAEVLGGPKVCAFARALAGDRSAVVIDTWAALAAYGERRPVTAARYREVSDAYETAAERVGETAQDLQAVLWLAVRGDRADDPAAFQAARYQPRLF